MEDRLILYSSGRRREIEDGVSSRLIGAGTSLAKRTGTQNYSYEFKIGKILPVNLRLNIHFITIISTRHESIINQTNTNINIKYKIQGELGRANKGL